RFPLASLRPSASWGSQLSTNEFLTECPFPRHLVLALERVTTQPASLHISPQWLDGSSAEQESHRRTTRGTRHRQPTLEKNGRASGYVSGVSSRGSAHPRGS